MLSSSILLFSSAAVTLEFSLSVFSTELFTGSWGFVSGSQEHHPMAVAAVDNSPRPAPTLPKRRIPRPVAPKDWSKAKSDPAATEPMEDCHAAAADPTEDNIQLYSTIAIEGTFLAIVKKIVRYLLTFQKSLASLKP